MAAERTQVVSRHYLAYLKKKNQEAQTGKRVVAPLDAVTLDRVELSFSSADNSTDTTWLTNYIKNMPNNEVSGKMKAYRDSFSTVDEAMTEKLLLELL